MGNIKVKYKKIDSNDSIESIITLPFLPLVGDEITLDDENKTVIQVIKINHCVEQKIAILDCKEKRSPKPLTKGFSRIGL